MIEYIVPENIDDRILSRSAKLLAQGALIAIPTDTSWGVVCSFQSKEGIKRLRRLSGEREERHFTLLCANISQFQEFCSLDNSRFRLINRLSPGPYTFILKTHLGTEKALGLRRSELGVRIPDHPVPLALVRTLGIPLYSITAKRSMLRDDDSGENAAENRDSHGLLVNGPLVNGSSIRELPPIPEEELFEGGWELEELEEISMILDPGEDQIRTFSTILDLSGDEVNLVRQGAGPWPY